MSPETLAAWRAACEATSDPDAVLYCASVLPAAIAEIEQQAARIRTLEEALANHGGAGVGFRMCGLTVYAKEQVSPPHDW